MSNKITIKQNVINNKNHLLELAKQEKACYKLTQWAEEQGYDNRMAFSNFKRALKEIDIDYSNIRNQNAADKLEQLKGEHTITLFSDAKAKNNRFGITDEDGDPLWYGQFYHVMDEQSAGEMEAAKKAVWLARKIADENTIDKINLILKVDAQWLRYANKWASDTKTGGKARQLMESAIKNRVYLKVEHVPGIDNPADEYTTCSGYLNWHDGIEGFEI